MNAIQRLESRLSEATELERAVSYALADDPDNFALQLSLTSARFEVSEVQDALVREKRARLVEVAELRFKGQLAEDGEMPLHLIGKFMQEVSDALHAAASVVRGTMSRYGHFTSEVVQSLNLRLAAVERGSTRIFITGDTMPDLFGHSLTEQTLSHVFGVLNADEEQITEAVSSVGIRSVHKIQSFLKQVEESGLELDFRWDATSGRKMWKGSRTAVTRLRRRLESIRETTQPLRIEGRIIELSLRGHIEIRPRGEDGSEQAPIVARYKEALLPTVQPFHIGQPVVAHLTATTYRNEATGQEKTKYELDTLRDPRVFGDLA